MDEDLYELHVCERGRWSCVERFRSSEREEAINEAQRHFASPNIEAVRVIREAFDENEQVFKQRTIYRNAKPGASGGNGSSAKAAPAAAAAPARRPAAPARPADPPKPARPPPPAAQLGSISRGRGPAEPESLGLAFTIVKRLLLAAAIGLFAPGILIVMVNSGALDRPLQQVGERTLYGAIVALFAISFLIALYLFSRAPKRAPAVRAGAAARPAVPGTPAGAAPAGSEDGGGDAGWAGRDMPLGGDPERDPVAEAVAAPAEPPVIDEALAGLQAGIEQKKADEKKKAEQKQAEAAAAPDEFAVAASVERETVLRFFRDGMAHPSTQPYMVDGRMAPHNRFGCHLFLLGAGKSCIAQTGADPGMLVPVMQSALELLGTDSERARAFVSKEREYAKDQKYAGMIQVGSKAMERYMAGNSGAATALGQALKAWNTGDATDAQGDNIAIMFTDMVSSVETTQALGDQGMMKLVQTHNLIVGSVLKTHRGHQVKHTGDGIMAVFPKVADGVAAACEIQRQIAEHNRVTASSFLKVRMGLAVGQPIRDQDDYFGTVVQLAARLCACAGEAEICVANAIAEQVGPTKRFQFSDVREVRLKGFAEAQKMRFLMWSQAAKVPAE